MMQKETISSDSLRELIVDLESKSVPLSEEEFWEIDNEIREVMDKFREDYAIREAQSIAETNKFVII